MVIVAHNCEDTKNCWIVHFKWVNHMWISPRKSCFRGFSYWSSDLDSAFPIQGGLVSVRGQGTTSHMLQLRVLTLQLKRSCMLQQRLKIPYTAIKTWHRRMIFFKVVFLKKYFKNRKSKCIHHQQSCTTRNVKEMPFIEKENNSIQKYGPTQKKKRAPKMITMWQNMFFLI